MKKEILLIGLFFAIGLSGCVEQPEPELRFVCSDGSIVDSPIACPQEKTLEELCQGFCAEQEQEEQASTADSIKAEMDEANYCQAKEDCVEADTKCPLGCYHLVNEAELDRINDLVKEFKQTCYQTCAALKDFNCVESKCEPIIFGTV